MSAAEAETYAARPLKRWTIQEAITFAAEAEATCSTAGFLLSLYGSTVRRGHGRDLDIILVPKCAIADADAVLRALCWRFNADVIGTPEPSMYADRCALLHLPSGALLDIQVRMGDPRRAEAQWEKYGAY